MPLKMYGLSSLSVSHDKVISKVHLSQSAFCIGFFDAEIQISGTWLQALIFYSVLPPKPPLDLADRLAN